MAEYGLFIGWGNAVRGREAKSVTVFNESVGYWRSLQERGEIESFEVAFLEAHGGDLAGFALLRGDRDKLAALRGSPDFQRAVTRANLIVEGLGVVGAVLDAGVGELMGRFGEAARELA